MFSSRRRHTRSLCDWSSDVCSSDLLRIGRLEGDGFTVAVIYHSHVDAGAYFSDTDKRQALIGDAPAYPGAAYLVTSVVGGRVESVAGFRWDAARGDFLPIDLEVSEPSSGRHAT